MAPSEDHYTAARECMASREADARAFWHRIDLHNETDADEARDEMAEYPLCLDYGDGRVRLIFGTGGPHDELSWRMYEDYGPPTSIRYTYLPWFGRVELTDVPEGLVRWAEDLCDSIELRRLPGYGE